jgi:hypothetical protein
MGFGLVLIAVLVAGDALVAARLEQLSISSAFPDDPAPPG